MKPVPTTEGSLVLRTDFSDDSAYDSLCAMILQPVDGFRAQVEFVSDPGFDGLTIDQVLSAQAPYARFFLFIVDRIAISHRDHPLLVLDTWDESGRGHTFRVVPSQVVSVSSNLEICNMDFASFEDAVDQDGIFRGFPDERQD